jgi:(4S)-4-hydroxy-5-phosphonooxypentane-2,3-dione isomerase
VTPWTIGTQVIWNDFRKRKVDPMIVLSVILNITEGQGDKFAAEWKKSALVARKEERGCIVYFLDRSVDNPDKFLVYEAYEDEEALKYHISRPNFLAYRKATADIVKSREVMRWQRAV